MLLLLHRLYTIGKNPIETMDANVLGLRKLLDYSLKVDLKSFYFFQQVKFMVIQIRKIYQLMKIIVAM